MPVILITPLVVHRLYPLILSREQNKEIMSAALPIFKTPIAFYVPHKPTKGPHDPIHKRYKHQTEPIFFLYIYTDLYAASTNCSSASETGASGSSSKSETVKVLLPRLLRMSAVATSFHISRAFCSISIPISRYDFPN